MEILRIYLESRLKDIVLWLDYLVYLIFNPFKFKKFPKRVNRILIIELLGIGDLIVTTPVIRALKSKYKNAEIHVVVKEEMYDVLYGNKNIDKLIKFPREFSVSNIKKGVYDLGIILHPGSFKVSLNLLLGKVKYRVGCTKVGIFSGKGFFLNKKIKPNTKRQHKIEDNLDVIRSIGSDTENKKLELFTDRRNELKVSNLLKKNKMNKKEFTVVIHPGANYKTHEWLPDRFAKVAMYLINDYKAKVIFTGSEKDNDLINNIRKQVRYKTFNFSGTTIKGYFSIIKRANLVVSVDTSAMHVAAAFDKPIVALFGAGKPYMWYPYTKNKAIIFKDGVCTSCLKNKCIIKSWECMKSIHVNDVIYAIDKLKR